MDLFATKTHTEREDEEASRLVKPAPKVKPPRHDRRRNEMQSEHDPDLDDNKRDPDLSLNQKGTTTAAMRVAARFLVAKVRRPKKPGAMHGRSKPKPKSPAKPPAGQPEEKIQAWTKDKGIPVQITEQTLRDNPAKYTDKDPKGEGGEGEVIKPMPVKQIGEPSSAKPSEKSDEPIKPMPVKQIGEPSEDKPKDKSEDKPKDKEPDSDGSDGAAVAAKLNELLDSGALTPKNIKGLQKSISMLGTVPPAFRDTMIQGVSALLGIPGLTADGLTQALAQMTPKDKAKPKAKPKTDKGKAQDADKGEATTAPPAASEGDQKAPAGKDEGKTPENKEDASEGAKQTPEGESPAPEKPEPTPEAKPEKGKGKGKKDKPEGGGLEPERPEMTESEQANVMLQAQKLLPPDVLAQVIAMHPADAAQVVQMYQGAKAGIPTGASIQKLTDAASKFYTTDPSKVPPPPTGKNKDGEEKPWDELSPQEQANALNEHRNKVLAKSLVLRAHVSKALANEVDAPPALINSIADFMLSKPSPDKGETAEQRQSRAEHAARKMFEEALAGEPGGMSSKDAKKLLKFVSKDPAAQSIAVGYLQGQDYQAIRQRFLDPNSPDAITEHMSPRQIRKSIEKAVNALNDMSAAYPGPAAFERDMGAMFRNRVLKQLKTLAPEKYKQLEGQFAQAEINEFKARKKKWGDDHVKLTEQLGKLEGQREEVTSKVESQRRDAEDGLKAALEKAQSAYEAAVQARQQDDELRQGGPYRGSGKADISDLEQELEDAKKAAQEDYEAANRKADSEERKFQQQVEAIEATQRAYERYEPLPPEHYDAKENKPIKVPKKNDEFWGDLFDARTAAMRIAIRFAYSSFGTGGTMSKQAQGREAAYWGVPVDRTGITPYPDWHQAHQGDLSESDLTGILKAARDWLKVPVLSVAVDGIVPDTQYRAALDLAIRTHEDGRYSAGVHPRVYNHLLAKLAGTSDDHDTLLTVREASDGSVYARARENTAMKTASAQIRSFAARVAESNPELAYDLVSLADKVAQEEKGKAFPGAAPPFGKDDKGDDKGDKKDEAKGQEKKASDDPKEAQGEQQGSQETQTKEASYQALRSAVIRTAAMSPQAKSALMPVLSLIKKLG